MRLDALAKPITSIGFFSMAVIMLVTVPALAQSTNGNNATEVKCPELGKVMNEKATNCAECVKDSPNKKSLAVVENPNSPSYFHIDKNSAYHIPPIPAGDGGHLLQVNLTAPGTIISVVQDCHGYPCGWIWGCNGATCQGHNVPVEYHGDSTAIWWGWSNSGDNAELVFIVHYQ